ncbi:hypothetical protein [uncultured Halomonas sp.]|uniref:hypothetical protein n=1 Tax=uncultured Halomonas sp. TaxID=173971 RepID=UPI00261D454D|nr:hypothetical protein [uncultured Halomonas sp.]
MAAQRRKSNRGTGKQTGRPAFSEPRMQVFSQFAGANFRLANRDVDNLLEEAEDAQTDLMPMFMAIQNNAHIAPMGGIETRRNIRKLFDAPAGKKLNGVVTLIGDRLYAATTDMNIHHGTIESGTLSSLVTISDKNETWEPEKRTRYTQVVS